MTDTSDTLRHEIDSLKHAYPMNCAPIVRKHLPLWQCIWEQWLSAFREISPGRANSLDSWAMVMQRREHCRTCLDDQSQILYLSGFGAAGKGTIAGCLEATFPRFCRIVNFTTRPARDRETDGKDYHFIKPAQFEEKMRQHKFLVVNRIINRGAYGIPTRAVLDSLNDQRIAIIEGLSTTICRLRHSTMLAAFNTHHIFITPPPPIFPHLVYRYVQRQVVQSANIDMADAEQTLGAWQVDELVEFNRIWKSQPRRTMLLFNISPAQTVRTLHERLSIELKPCF